MKLTLTGKAPILEIQQEFNREFPYLKLEFFSRSHTKGMPTSINYMIKPGKSLGEFGFGNKESEIEVYGSKTVSELENEFKNRFSLNVQVFRKSGRIWLETTATDDWTLDSQNEQGKELSEYTKDRDDLPDYHEQE
jgi:hypothetical protein